MTVSAVKLPSFERISGCDGAHDGDVVTSLMNNKGSKVEHTTVGKLLGFV